MTDYLSHTPNTFCWVDLATTDPKAAKEFYQDVFGWSFLDTPMGEGAFYTMCLINGKPVAALYEMMPQQKEMNLPCHWFSYISVADGADTMKKVKESNGNVIMDCMDVMEEGRSGMFQDPGGAMVGIWEPKKHIGASYKNIHGTICWFEYGSHDRNIPIPFLEKVFGWTSKTEKMGETIYTTFYLGQEAVAGLYEMPENMNDVPAHWLPYFAINNIDEALEKCAKHNAIILMPKMFVQGVGHFAVIQDPQGAVLGLVQGEM